MRVQLNFLVLGYLLFLGWWAWSSTNKARILQPKKNFLKFASYERDYYYFFFN